MKIISFLIVTTGIIIGIFIGSFYYYLSPFHNAPTAASAIIYPIKNHLIQGNVSFTKEKTGIRIKASIQGLTPGKHGFHIHKYGNCSGHNGTCAGDHFNPTNALHGAPDDIKVHIGDLGNITADEHGNAEYDEINYHIKLFGPHSIIGRSVIIHENADDLHTQPTGNAGNRIGCGVVGINN